MACRLNSPVTCLLPALLLHAMEPSGHGPTGSLRGPACPGQISSTAVWTLRLWLLPVTLMSQDPPLPNPARPFPVAFALSPRSLLAPNCCFSFQAPRTLAGSEAFWALDPRVHRSCRLPARLPLSLPDPGHTMLPPTHPGPAPPSRGLGSLQGERAKTALGASVTGAGHC